jgi:hypothetical protein
MNSIDLTECGLHWRNCAVARRLNEHNSGRAGVDHTVTRRTFIGTTALGTGRFFTHGNDQPSRL